MTATLVLDNTVLSHFARANHLQTLAELTSNFRCVTTDEVIIEVNNGVKLHAALAAIATLPWLEVRSIDNIAELASFAKFKGILGGGPFKNNGECAVLAWAKNNNATAIIDDSAASNLAREEGIVCHGTIWLVINAFKRQLLSRSEAESLINQLAENQRLPTDGAGLFVWAYQNGLLP